MALRYEETARLQRGLEGGISVVAFSADGTYIATAGIEDPKTYIWRVADHKLLHTYTGSHHPFLTLEWLPGRSDTVLCGSSDGYIAMLRFGSDISEVTGFWAHAYPVERLAAQGDRLVSGAQPEVCVWKRSSHDQWKHIGDLCGPPTDSKNADEELIVMGVHWTKTRLHHSVVAITYMHHGIILYNADDWSRLHVFSFNDIGGSSVSPKGSMIALSIMGSGFDVYDLDTGDCVASFPDESDGTRTVPVLFVHGGRALFGGSTVGRATLWNVVNQRIHQTLAPEPYKTILAIAANYNAEHDRFLLATGGNDADGKSTVVLWMAQADVPRKQNSKWFSGRMCMSLGMVAWAVIVALVVLSMSDVLAGINSGLI